MTAPSHSQESPPLLVRRHTRGRGFVASVEQLSTIYASLTFLLLVGDPVFRTLGAATFLASGMLYLLWRRAEIVTALLPMAILFLLPIWGLLSVAWSVDPAVSLRGGIQYLATVVIVVFLARTLPPARLLQALFIAAFVAILVSFAAHPQGVAGVSPLRGIFGSKNMCAFVASVLTLAAAGVVLDRRHQRLVRLCALAGVVAGGFAVYRAQSAGAIVSTVVGLAILIGGVALQQTSRAVRAAFVAVTLAALPIVALNAPAIEEAAAEFSIDVLGKDTTLTGRTYLWDRAGPIIAERPMLGLGLMGFWRQGAPDAEGLWAYAGIKNRGGFNFHNQYIDLAVDLGYVGVALFTVAMICGLVGLGIRTIRERSPALVVFFALLLSFAMRSPIESTLVGQFAFLPSLYVTALTLGLSFRGEVVDSRTALNEAQRRARRRRPLMT